MIPSRTVVRRYQFIAVGTRPRIDEAKGAVVHRYHIIAAGTRPRMISNCGVRYLKQMSVFACDGPPLSLYSGRDEAPNDRRL